jgi:hypothetical protein
MRAERLCASHGALRERFGGALTASAPIVIGARAGAHRLGDARVPVRVV